MEKYSCIAIMFKSLSTLLFLCLLMTIQADDDDDESTKAAAGPKERKRDRFREWLKYDAECEFLEEKEREIRVSQGRCPPLPSTTSPVPIRETFFQKKKRERQLRRERAKQSFFTHGSKKKLLSTITLGQQSTDDIVLSVDNERYTLIAGTMLSVTCLENLTQTDIVEWYVNKNLIENKLLDWRVTAGSDGVLSIWPLLIDDAGLFECFVNGVFQASGNLDIVTKGDALLRGLANYFIVAAFYLPVMCYAIFLIGSRAADPPEKDEREDKMAEFLEEHVKKNGKAAKENMARLVYGENFVQRQQEMTQSLAVGIGPNGEKLRNNRDTIMTVLAPPSLRKRAPAKKKADVVPV